MATQTTTELDIIPIDQNPNKTLTPSVHALGESSFPAKPSSTPIRSASIQALPSPSTPQHNRPPPLSTLSSTLLITQIALFNLLTSFSSGILTISLPILTSTLPSLPPSLALWPVSVYSLTSGALLLLAGSLTDALGPKKVHIAGCAVCGLALLGCGFARDGPGLIAARAVQGVGAALVVPSGVAMVAGRVERGRLRNVGFAAVFLTFVIGFGVGLVLGGIIDDRAGWRVGFWVGGGLAVAVTGLGVWTLPADEGREEWWKSIGRRAGKDIDWVGAGIACGSLSVLSFVLSKLAVDASKIRHADTIGLLVVSLALMPVFVAWMHHQEKRGRPALIPDSIWKNGSFTSVCLMILLTNAFITALSQFCSLYFQRVQMLSAFDSSLRIIPQVVVGGSMSIVGGIFVNKLPAVPLVVVSSALCAVSPLLMAISNPAWPYWYSLFWAQLLAPLSIDILFLVGTLVVSDAFPPQTQGLASAVFNTFASVGTSIALCITAVIAANVTSHSPYKDKNSPQALLEGYRASFWTLFAWTLASCLIGAFGLRKLDHVGKKRD